MSDKVKIIPEIRLVPVPEIYEGCCNGCYYLDKCEECDSEVGFIWVEEKTFKGELNERCTVNLRMHGNK